MNEVIKLNFQVVGKAIRIIVNLNQNNNNMTINDCYF